MKIMFHLVEICGKELGKCLDIVTADGKWSEVTALHSYWRYTTVSINFSAQRRARTI
jgi:hypothetical protein